ncbi:pro-neuregulin-4, membrane-bound isoform isoform X1 [Corapipo altera]|uniref:pro-neuregulin-4, membrane-bound isoform isoform X1 n=1 Tax=Corapipo altera TaxID=415028 RepID=UPI000FD6B553|nr:pro-neuregulin-4, membrane-bound isoform isoform X1 [Corapipo altera]
MTQGGTRNLETHLEGDTGSQVSKGLSGAFLREKVAKNHEELCGTSYGSFCLNGGICYMIPTVSSPFCRCIEHYTGARCEEVLLPSIKSQTKGDLFAAFLASLLLLGVLVIGAFYFLCRKVSIPRTSSSECGANLAEPTSSNGCNKITTA